MKSLMQKKIPVPVIAMLCLICIAAADWKHFLPLSAHTDLRFQAIGECIEVLVILGTSALTYLVFIKERRRNVPVSSSTGKQITLVAAFSVLNIATGWRAFFPNDQLDLHLAIGTLFDAVFIGVIFLSLESAFNELARKPDKEEDNSVA